MIERKMMMVFDSIVRIFSGRRFEFRADFLALILLLTFFPGSMLSPFMANALAQTIDQSSRQVGAPGVELDEKTLKSNVATRIRATRGAQDARFRQFSPELVIIDRKVSFNIQGMTFFAVKVKLLSPPPGAGEETITLVLDKSGTLQIVDIQELTSGNSLVQDAMNQLVRIEDIPPDFGKEIFKGKGTHSIIAVSDPFCPYCRKGWNYIKTRQDKLETFRLSHFPLNRPAEAACMVMADAHHRQFKFFEIVDFAYTHLNPASNPQDILAQFMDAFPELKEKWGQDAEVALKYLEEKYLAMVQKEKKDAQALGINSTPVFFVNGQLIRGFNAGKMDMAMP
jgi:protein-disulfide isomerase